MDIATLAGLGICIFFIVFGILLGGTLGAFVSISSMFITYGGTLGGLFIQFKMDQVKNAINIAKKAFNNEETDIEKLISDIVGYAEMARREGLLVLEREIEKIEDSFLEKGVRLIIDGAEQEVVKSMMEIELQYLAERHALGKEIWDSLGASCPSWGMIGTIIGLIIMLGNLSDPTSLGPAMATALLTTFYGAVGAFMVFTPIAGKLSVKSKEEILTKKIIIEGVLSVQTGDNPRMVEEKLKLFLPPSKRGFETLKKG